MVKFILFKKLYCTRTIQQKRKKRRKRLARSKEAKTLEMKKRARNIRGTKQDLEVRVEDQAVAGTRLPGTRGPAPEKMEDLAVKSILPKRGMNQTRMVKMKKKRRPYEKSSVKSTAKILVKNVGGHIKVRILLAIPFIIMKNAQKSMVFITRVTFVDSISHTLQDSH